MKKVLLTLTMILIYSTHGMNAACSSGNCSVVESKSDQIAQLQSLLNEDSGIGQSDRDRIVRQIWWDKPVIGNWSKRNLLFWGSMTLQAGLILFSGYRNWDRILKKIITSR